MGLLLGEILVNEIVFIALQVVGIGAFVLSRSPPLNFEITQVLGKYNKCSDQSSSLGLRQDWILGLAKLKVKVKVSLPCEVIWRSTAGISPVRLQPALYISSHLHGRV